ncbi:MAG: hypothetical protein HYU78_17215 [Rhodocyclales bacterium]|nr:hypothetical protein [Rhodocyclales bacterium]
MSVTENSRRRPRGVAALAGAVAAATTLAAARPAAAEAPAAPPPSGQKMKMDEPMSGAMKKRGMTKGDVRKDAERKSRAMKPVMDTEEKAMPAAPKP